jgi:hypothetical protein
MKVHSTDHLDPLIVPLLVTHFVSLFDHSIPETIGNNYFISPHYFSPTCMGEERGLRDRDSGAAFKGRPRLSQGASHA